MRVFCVRVLCVYVCVCVVCVAVVVVVLEEDEEGVVVCVVFVCQG